MRIAIIDNDQRARRVIERYCGLTTGVAIVGEAATLQDAKRLVAEQRPDAVFLEVRLGSENGFDLLGEPSVAPQPLVVVTTAHEQFAIQAFDRQVADYLLKPFEFARFNQSLDRLRVLLGARNADTPGSERPAALFSSGFSSRPLPSSPTIHVSAEPDGRTVVLPVEDMLLVRADRNHLEIECLDGRLRTRCPIKTAAEALLPLGFLRVHRSVLINGSAIREIRAQGQGKLAVALVTGAVVPVSAGYRDAMVRFGRGRTLRIIAGKPVRVQKATDLPD